MFSSLLEVYSELLMRPQGLGTEVVLQEENPIMLQSPWCWTRARLPIKAFQRQLALTVEFVILSPLNLPRERLGESTHLG